MGDDNPKCPVLPRNLNCLRLLSAPAAHSSSWVAQLCMRPARLLLAERHVLLVSLGKGSSRGFSGARCPALAFPNSARGPQRSRTLVASAFASMPAFKPTDVRVVTYNVLSSHLGGVGAPLLSPMA